MLAHGNILPFRLFARIGIYDSARVRSLGAMFEKLLELC